MRLEATRIVDPVERLQHPAGQLIAGIGPAGHPVTKHGDQVEIAFGFSQNLLPADATGVRHDRLIDITRGHWRKTAFLFRNSNRPRESAKSGVSYCARFFGFSAPARPVKADAQRLRSANRRY